MSATFVRFVLFAFVLLASARSTQANTVSATINLAGLPSTITLCHDPAAAGTYGADEQWVVGIDVDANSATPSGANAARGAEVLLVAQTTPQNPGCTPTTVSTASNIIAGMLVWNATQQNYVTSSTQPVNLTFGANSFTLSADVSGALANLSSASDFWEFDQGAYTSGATPTSAYDGTTTLITTGYGLTLPAGDVQGCSAPCSPTAPWYQLVDLVGFNVSTTTPLSPPSSPPPVPPFGANTVDAEFDLTSLPTSINTCPGNRSGYGYDLIWIAGTNLNASLGAYETLVTAHTPLADGCGGILSLTTLNGTLFHIDPNNPANGYTAVANLPVKVDTVHGKIVVQADRTNQYLSGLSSSTVMTFITVGEAASSATGDFSPIGTAAQLFNTFPTDNGPQFNFGGSFTTPANNVCASATNCTSSASPQIDLTGGSAHMDDYVFRNGFEPQ